MKDRGCWVPIDGAFPTYCGVGSKEKSNLHRHTLLKIGLLLILCWTISAILLIGQRRSERSEEDVWQRKTTVAHVLPTETLNHR